MPHASGRVIVRANCAPFSREWTVDGRASLKRSVIGLVTALDPLVEARSETWVAHGVGTAGMPRVGDRGALDVPTTNPQHRLRSVRLADDEHRGHSHIPSPWLLAVRTFASVVGTIGGALTHALWRCSPFGGGVSISPVSPQWLLDHEILSSKHQDHV